MVEVTFYEEGQVADQRLGFAVILARSGGKWVFCRHEARDTWEVPGGHRESGETIRAAAERELREETGAIRFQLRPVCVYSVRETPRAGAGTPEESFGMLFTAEIESFEGQLHSEIAEISLQETLAEHWTYPEIQPRLLEEAARRGCLSL